MGDPVPDPRGARSLNVSALATMFQHGALVGGSNYIAVILLMSTLHLAIFLWFNLVFS